MNDELKRLERWYKEEMPRSRTISEKNTIEWEYRKRKIEIERRMAIVENRYLPDWRDASPYLIEEGTRTLISRSKSSDITIQKQEDVTLKYVTPRAKRLMKIAQQITIET